MAGVRRERLELAPRSDGARYRRVSLSVDGEGALTLLSHEMGASLQAAWGLDDDELTLTGAAEDVGRLALALAAELLKGGQGPTTRLAELCEAYEVPCRIACWT